MCNCARYNLSFFGGGLKAIKVSPRDIRHIKVGATVRLSEDLKKVKDSLVDEDYWRDSITSVCNVVFYKSCTYFDCYRSSLS